MPPRVSGLVLVLIIGGDGGLSQLGVQSTTPAQAGAQLGNVANEGLRFITLAFPPGPRPAPGW